MSRMTLRALALATLAVAPLRALPFDSYYDSNCSACHGTVALGGTRTCAGCHAHGVHPSSAKSSVDLTGATSKSSYAPGETVSVVVDAGYRSGWVRAVLYDQNLQELARSGGTVLPGFSAPCCGQGFPITLSAPAPTTPGSYTWWVAWYGNQFDSGGAAFGPNWTPMGPSGHGIERVQTNSFTVVAPTSPGIALSPPSLTFDTVNVGTPAALEASIQNTGTAALNVTAIARCSGTSTEFTWSPAAPVTVQPGQSATLTVTFTPVDSDSEVGCLAIASNAPASPTTELGLSGSGAVPAAPAIALSPGSLTFGTVTIGGSAVLVSQVQNGGNAPLDVTSITPCAGTAAVFTWSPPAPFTVAAGGSSALSVTYTPTAATGDSGCLAISSSDPVRPTVNLTVSGNGAAAAAPAIAFSPASLDFGTVTIGNPAQRTAQVQNAGNATLTVSDIAPCSGAGTEFTWSTTLPFSIAPGQGVPFTVTYTPVDIDFHSACIAFTSDDPARPVANLGVTAQGASAPTPAVALVPPALDFMTVQVGASSSLVAQVENNGGAQLGVAAIAACSGTSAEFTWSPSAPFTVGSGQAQSLTVTYAPTDEGLDNGCLALSTDDPARPVVNLSVSGTGSSVVVFPAIALVPDSLDFGTVTVGGSAMRTSEVRNTGAAPLDVLGIAACAGTSPEYTAAPPAPFTVAPGQSTTVSVTYAPTDTGPDTGCFSIASNDPTSSSIELQLRGTGASTPVAGVDIDVDELRIPRKVDPSRTPSITPQLHAKNPGKVSGTAPATLVGTLGGVTVYEETIPITLPRGEDGEFPFPPYALAPAASGTVRWLLTIADDNPDRDEARARTEIRSRGGDDDDDEDDDDEEDHDVASSGGSGSEAGSSNQAADAGVMKASSTGCSTGGPAAPAALLALAAWAAGRTWRRRIR